MKKKSANDILDESILLLEKKRNIELFELKEELDGLVDNLKPVNIIKDTIKKITSSDEIKEGIGKSVLGVAAGLLVKNLLFRNSISPLKVIGRTLVQTAVSGAVASNFDKIKLKGLNLLHHLLNRA
jgi:hypothetical protein